MRAAMRASTCCICWWRRSNRPPSARSPRRVAVRRRRRSDLVVGPLRQGLRTHRRRLQRLGAPASWRPSERSSFFSLCARERGQRSAGRRAGAGGRRAPRHASAARRASHGDPRRQRESACTAIFSAAEAQLLQLCVEGAGDSRTAPASPRPLASRRRARRHSRVLYALRSSLDAHASVCSWQAARRRRGGRCGARARELLGEAAVRHLEVLAVALEAELSLLQRSAAARRAPSRRPPPPVAPARRATSAPLARRGGRSRSPAASPRRSQTRAPPARRAPRRAPRWRRASRVGTRGSSPSRAVAPSHRRATWRSPPPRRPLDAEEVLRHAADEAVGVVFCRLGERVRDAFGELAAHGRRASPPPTALGLGAARRLGPCSPAMVCACPTTDVCVDWNTCAPPAGRAAPRPTRRSGLGAQRLEVGRQARSRYAAWIAPCASASFAVISSRCSASAFDCFSSALHAASSLVIDACFLSASAAGGGACRSAAARRRRSRCRRSRRPSCQFAEPPGCAVQSFEPSGLRKWTSLKCANGRAIQRRRHTARTRREGVAMNPRIAAHRHLELLMVPLLPH